jgi:hypothetical protein
MYLESSEERKSQRSVTNSQPKEAVGMQRLDQNRYRRSFPFPRTPAASPPNQIAAMACRPFRPRSAAMEPQDPYLGGVVDGKNCSIKES